MTSVYYAGEIITGILITPFILKSLKCFYYTYGYDPHSKEVGVLT